jgi:hypothetical protein
MKHQLRSFNKAPAPNRRPRVPLGAFRWFAYLFSAQPASPAAVGEAQRWPFRSSIEESDDTLLNIN